MHIVVLIMIKSTAMPESSAWQDICRWEFCEEEFEMESEDAEDDKGRSSSPGSEVIQQDRDNRVILLKSSTTGLYCRLNLNP